MLKARLGISTAAWTGSLLALLLAAGHAHADTRVGPGIDDALGAAGSVRVLVMFAEPASETPLLTLSESRRERIAKVRSDLLRGVPPGSVKQRRQFEFVPGFAADIDAQGLRALLQNSSVLRIDLDEGGRGDMAEAAPLARITDLFNAGHIGTGAKIAVIDSGIDLDHADFTGRIVGQQCFCAGPGGAVGCCPNGADTQSGAGAAEDDHGHGTNVTGIAAGGGAVAARGAAPGADIVSVKVLDSSNSFCCSSDVVAALDWVLVNHPDTEVVNASLGTGALFTGHCDAAASFTQAMAAAVNNLSANGTMVFASAGNQRSASQMSAPACVEKTIGVGAVYDSNLGDTNFGFFGCGDLGAVADLPTCFSNSSTTTDLYAPGAYSTSSGVGGGTTTFAGTSQASPLSAGCAAVLRMKVPSASADEVEAAIKASPIRVIDPKNGFEFPRLDCLDALSRLDAEMFSNGFEALPNRPAAVAR